jgi:hypothetical protein
VKLVKDHFDDAFAHWKIRLPSGDIARRQRGKIVKAGWSIWYLFGSDKKGEYLIAFSSLNEEKVFVC